MRSFARLTKLILGLFGVLVVLGLALMTVLLFLEPTLLREQLASRAAEAFNRRVSLNGPIHLEPSWKPRIVAEDLRIGNPEWASRPDLARVQRLEVQVALWPLLQGKVQVLEAVFQGADLLLEAASDGRNNFTFRHSQGPPELPGVDRLSIRDSIIGYRRGEREPFDCWVAEAVAKNDPKQPVEIAGQMVCRDVAMEVSLLGGISEQFASPGIPWPLSLTVTTEGMSLIVGGSLHHPKRRGETAFQVSLEGDNVDALDALFGWRLPVHAPFELSAGLGKSEQGYRFPGLEGRIGVTDVAGNLHWQRLGGRVHLRGDIASRSLHIRDFLIKSNSSSADGTRLHVLDRPLSLNWIKAIDADLELDIGRILGVPVAVENAMTTFRLGGGRLHLAPLQATLTGIPLSGSFTIDPTLEAPAIRVATQTGRLDLGSMLERLEVNVPIRGNADSLTLALNSRGHTLRTLLRHADVTLEARGGRITAHESDAENPWTLAVTGARLEAREAAPVRVRLEGETRGIPLSLALDAGPMETLIAPGASPWPLALTLSTEDATLAAKGSIPTLGTWNGADFQVSLRGERVDALRALVAMDLPLNGAFELSARLNKSAQGYAVSGLEGRIGGTDIAGELQWQQAEARPVLKGRLVSNTLRLQDFTAGSDSKPAPKTGFLDRPLPRDALASLDAALDFDIKRIRGAALPIRNVSATAKLAGGQLTLAPLRATLAGTPVSGDFTFTPGSDATAIKLAARSRRLDLGGTLRQLKVGSGQTQGRLEDVRLTVSGRGQTPRTLLRRAELSLKTRGGQITFGGTGVNQASTLRISGAAVAARSARPISIRVDAIYRRIPLALTVDTLTLEALGTATTGPWPLTVSLRSSPLDLSARGSVRQPFQGSGFDLEFEMVGSDLRQLDPLIDFVIPLRGDYRIRGRFSDAERRYRFRNLRATVGRSDIKGALAILVDTPRPKIITDLASRTFHFGALQRAKGDNRRDSRFIPEYSIPVKALRSVDLDINLQARRIRMATRDLGDMTLRAKVDDGVSVWSVRLTGIRTGARLSFKNRVDVNTDPPLNSLELTARDLDYGLLLTESRLASFAQGDVDVELSLTGRGATLRRFLGQADGHINVMGGAGRISSRQLELWASGLVRAMLPDRWGSGGMMELNCVVGHIDVKRGVASTDKLLVDMPQVTIAGSGALNLETERLDLLLSPDLKQTSLVSFANPVRVTGTLRAPSVAITKLPRLGTAGASGLLAGLVNPAFLLLTFSDIGSDDGNPCMAAIEQRDLKPTDKPPRRGILDRFRSLF